MSERDAHATTRTHTGGLACPAGSRHARRREEQAEGDDEAGIVDIQ